MSTALLERPIAPVSSTGNGGMPARRAMSRWAWRLFRREWRQQFLILALIVVAVAATIIGSAVATNTPPPADSGFGTAQDSASFQSPDPHLATQISSLQHTVGVIDVIENETLSIPGSITTYDLRAQNPRGAFGQPMLSLLSGHFPTSGNQVAITRVLATDFHLRVGQTWNQNGVSRQVVGLVENPQSLLDEFALVLPGEVNAPSQVTALFDANGGTKSLKGFNVETPGSATSSNAINPQTISIAVLVLGMLLIALVSVGGFTVLAQRRLRSLGMLQSLGATDKHVGVVVRANGLVVGVVGALLGGIIGLVGWLAYRPSLEQSSHHLIGMFALPWTVVILALVLAVAATYFAASRPAKAMAKVPVVAALSGRPAPPRQISRSAVPGVACLIGAFLLLTYAGAGSGAQPHTPEMILGLLILIPALRDLARYRARSGSALSAISIGVLIAVVISLVAAARYGNVFDYAGPNLASDQVALYVNTPPPPGSIHIGPVGSNGAAPETTSNVTVAESAKSAKMIATALGATHFIALESLNSGGLGHVGPGRAFSGQIYVATPQLLSAFGISASQVQTGADFISMRPGLSGASGLQFVFNTESNKGGPPRQPGSSASDACTPANGCIAPAPIQELSALPSGTSAPNTVVTEYAVHKYHLQTSLAGWLVQTKTPPTAAQISNARTTAAGANMSIETRNSAPSSNEIIDFATLFGIALALGILAMSVGLIRSETADELRTLEATGASSSTRRTITAVTAGGLGLLGALLGTVAGYIGVAGYLESNSLNGGLSALTNVPVNSLLFIVVGMPVLATVIGWLLAGRGQSAMARQPMT
jgi:putative ABC transport system permease protein